MRKISINDGNSFCTVEEAIEYLTFEDDFDFDTLGYYMNDKEAFEKVMNEWQNKDFTLHQLITRYLELANCDLIIK